jgi:hypothetical protein
MKKHLSFLYLLPLCFLCPALRAQTDPILRHLPPDAGKVYRIDLASLLSKGNLSDFLNSLPDKPANSQPVIDIVKDPSAGGVDIHQPIFIATTSPSGLDSPTYTSIFIPLADSASFITGVNKFYPGIRIIHLTGKGRTAGKEKTGIAWNNQLAVITIVKPPVSLAFNFQDSAVAMTPAPKKSPSPKTRHPAPVIHYEVLAAKRSLAALRGYDHSFFLTDTIFQSGLSGQADFLAISLGGMQMPGMIKSMMSKTVNLSSLMDHSKKPGRYNITSLQFEPGKISISSKTFLKADEAAVVAKFDTRPLNADLIARFPPDRLLGVAALHFDPSVISDILAKYKSRAKVDSMLAKAGLTLDDVLGVFKGDFMLAALAPDKGMADTIAKKPDFYFITTLNNPAALLKVVLKLKSHQPPPSPDDSTAGDQRMDTTNLIPRRGMFARTSTAFSFQDNILVVGRNKQLTDGYFKMTAQGNNQLFSPRMQNNPFNLVVDIKVVKSFLHAITTDTAAKTQKLFTILDKFDRVITAGGAVDGNWLKTDCEIDFNDKSKNSLQSLIELVY